MRLIDADKAERDIEELRKSDWFNAPYLTRERKLGLSEAFDMIQGVCIKHAPTVDAVPVSYIQQRIDHLQDIADFALDSNGGYIESANSSLYELKLLLSRWKAEQSAKDK